ncbi:MAG: purine-nucleoside phosphorylase [Paludibacteraceae bacterium]|nr:purine-nucleoside phosphorylase [Paludibacteraceae bacterium]
MAKENCPTPHNGAKYGEIAKTVIMSGDPLRAKFMAERYLEDYKQVTNVRGMLGFTGKYKGQEISVMGHGMGIPSIGIYTYELFNFYDAERIIRLGSAGTFDEKMQIGDVLMAEGACTNSNYLDQFELRGVWAPIADFGLLRAAVEEAEKLGVRYQVGNVLSSDSFYTAGDAGNDRWVKMGVKGVEMEAAALYANAAYAGKKALCMCTISDNIKTGEALSAEDRQLCMTNMMDVAFNMI